VTAAEATPAVTPASSSTRGRPRILCVDDDPLVLEAMANTLHRKASVATSASSAEALRLLTAGDPFTIVISDFLMPGMNGAEFLGHAKQVAPDTIRMLLTGCASVDCAIAAVNKGHVFRFLTKPCAPADLLTAIDDACEQSRLITADHGLVQREVERLAGNLIRAERLASVGTMVGAIGHELNNLLTAFVFALDKINTDAAAGSVPSLEDLNRLEQIEEHLELHARSLLQLGRPGGSKAGGTADLRAVVLDIAATLRAAGLFSRARLRLDVGIDPVVVSAGKTELEQILVNLTRNAVDALRDCDRPDASVALSIEPTSDRSTTLIVADNANGIAEESLSQIFEPYFTTKPPDRGTGLGLFVVRRIVRDAGGDVTVESIAGRGTRFRIELPLADASPQHARR
jgi:two-component system, NtrC family, sensor kinase